MKHFFREAKVKCKLTVKCHTTGGSFFIQLHLRLSLIQCKTMMLNNYDILAKRPQDCESTTPPTITLNKTTEHIFISLPNIRHISSYTSLRL